MIRLTALVIVAPLAACQSICTAFPEWNELGYENDVEHNAAGQVETGLPKLAGQLAEIVVDPSCLLGSKLDLVSRP